MMSAGQIAQALGGAKREGGGWRCRCPLAREHANGDATPSLSVSERDGRILVHCHSRHTDEQERVISALKDGGLWPDSGERRRAERADRKPNSAPDSQPGPHWRPLLPVPPNAPRGDLSKT